MFTNSPLSTAHCPLSTVHCPLLTIHCPLSSFRLAPDCATLRRAKRVDRLHPAPRSLARTHRPACLPSTPDRRFAMPLPHNLHGQTVSCLPPLRRPIAVRTRPSHRPADGGSAAFPPPGRPSQLQESGSSCSGRLSRPD